MSVQRIKKSKDHAPSFQSLLLLYNIQVFHSTEKNLITFKIFTIYDIKLWKIWIKSKSLFLERIGKKLSNLSTFIDIVGSQVHIWTIEYSTEMEVCFSVALGLRPTFICIWKTHISNISFNCLAVFLQ